MLRLVAVFREREVDRHEAGLVVGHQFPLASQRASDVLRHAGRIRKLGVGVGEGVSRRATWIALMKSCLHDDQGPVRVGLEDRPERGEDACLGVVHGLHHYDQAVGLAFEHTQVVARVVVDLAQPPGVEELEEEVVFAGKGIELGRARAGAEPAADFGATAAGERADNRRLS